MSKVCDYCGKRPAAGRTYARRGKAKAKGGVGKKITGVTPRSFKPNIQRVHAIVPGKGVTRVRVCAQCLRTGVVQKPLHDTPKKA